jgi:hypothetical protein
MSLSRIFPTIISSEITAGNALIDSTTDNAFIAPVGVDLSPYRGKFMELWSGSTLWAQAWISATAPSGLAETEAIVNGDFSAWTGDNPNSWSFIGTEDANNYITQDPAGQAKMARGATGYYHPLQSIITTGGLYHSSIDINAITGTFTFHSGAYIYASYTTTGTKTAYWTQFYSNSLYLFLAANSTATIDNVSAKCVTMPAATGALLLSTQGGSRGWAYKHASFNPNAALTMRILAKRKVSGNGSYLV